MFWTICWMQIMCLFYLHCAFVWWRESHREGQWEKGLREERKPWFALFWRLAERRGNAQEKCGQVTYNSRGHVLVSCFVYDCLNFLINGHCKHRNWTRESPRFWLQLRGCREYAKLLASRLVTVQRRVQPSETSSRSCSGWSEGRHETPSVSYERASTAKWLLFAFWNIRYRVTLIAHLKWRGCFGHYELKRRTRPATLRLGSVQYAGWDWGCAWVCVCEWAHGFCVLNV